jgi:hypothetical protein
MARATETGFYFEPITERLALVIEGAPFPDDEQWAWVGDPAEMTPELARLECAVRWPGVDPDLLHVELDLGTDRLLAELEAQQRAEAQAVQASSPADVQALLAQAHELQRAVAELHTGPITRQQLEAEAERIALARESAPLPGAARERLATRELQQLLAEQDPPPKRK